MTMTSAIRDTQNAAIPQQPNFSAASPHSTDVQPSGFKPLPQWVADQRAAGRFVELGQVFARLRAQVAPQIAQLIADAKAQTGGHLDRHGYTTIQNILEREAQQIAENEGWLFVLRSDYIQKGITDEICRLLDVALSKPKGRPNIDRGKQQARAHIAKKKGWGTYDYDKALKGWERGLKRYNPKRAAGAQAKASTIMVLTALGHDRFAIAARLGCDESTVRWHRRRGGQVDVEKLASLFKSEAEYARDGTENSTATQVVDNSNTLTAALSPHPSLAYSADEVPEVSQPPPDFPDQASILREWDEIADVSGGIGQ